jgi:hypothetical protein
MQPSQNPKKSRLSNGTMRSTSCRRSPGVTTALAIYVRLNERHFTFSDDIRTPHQECCKRVFHSQAYRTTAQASGVEPLSAQDDIER